MANNLFNSNESYDFLFVFLNLIWYLFLKKWIAQCEYGLESKVSTENIAKLVYEICHLYTEYYSGLSEAVSCEVADPIQSHSSSKWTLASQQPICGHC